MAKTKRVIRPFVEGYLDRNDVEQGILDGTLFSVTPVPGKVKFHSIFFSIKNIKIQLSLMKFLIIYNVFQMSPSIDAINFPIDITMRKLSIESVKSLSYQMTTKHLSHK